MREKVLPLLITLIFILPLVAMIHPAPASPGCVVTFHVKSCYQIPLYNARVEIRNRTTNELIAYSYTDVYGRDWFDLEFWTTYNYVVIKSPYKTESGWFSTSGFATQDERVTMWLQFPLTAVGGNVVAVDKFGLLAPYIGLASTIAVATVATAIYVKRRKEKQ